MTTNRKLAVITGVTGQDGAYLSKLLLEKGYVVIGVVRRSSVNTTTRLSILNVLNNDSFKLVEGDVTDAHSMNSIITKYQPDEVYHLAGQSDVHTSFQQPGYTWNVNANGCLFMLESIRNYCPAAHFYFAASSEMFGTNFTTSYPQDDDLAWGIGWRKSSAPPRLFQNEQTPFAPTSPYAVAKLAAYHTVQTYRRAYGLHVSSGILFNHESKLRGEAFVTKKITQWVAKTAQYVDEHGPLNADTFPANKKIRLGNLDACRDWGYAPCYVNGMFLMLQQEKPDDYVIATGETRTVLDFVCAAFKAVGWNDDPEFVRQFIYIDPEFYRPSEVEYLLGDSTKAREKLGWEPNITFTEMVDIMVQYDLSLL